MIFSLFVVCSAEEPLYTPPSLDNAQREKSIVDERELLTARNATDELDLSVELDTLTMVMETSGLVKVNFTLYCVHPSVRYSLAMSTEDPKVAVVDSSTLFNFSCADATVDSSPGSVGLGEGGITSNAASSALTTMPPGDTSSHPHDALLQALPRVSGSFNFTMYADVLGRTWLRVSGERGADQDVVLPVFLKLPWMSLQLTLLYANKDHRRVNDSDVVLTNSSEDVVTYDATGGAGSPGDDVHFNVSGRGLRVMRRHVVTVVRVVRPVDVAFRFILYAFVMMVTVGMGCKTELSAVKSVLTKPIAPAIGFFCQYLLMPLIAFMLAKTLTVGDPAVSLGIFACGICPGGGASNMFSYLLDGDVSLSVTMTAISSIGALAMIPLWLFTLGTRFQDDKITLKVPFDRICITLALLIIPLFIGVLIKHKFPKVARIILKFLKPVSLLVILIVVTFGTYTNLYILKLFAPGTLAAGCLLPYIGYILGGITSFILCQSFSRVKTISIETGIQNTSIAYLLLVFSLPTPDGDMAAVGPAASAIMTPLPLLVLVILYMLYKRFCKKKQEGEGEEESQDVDGEAVGLKNSKDKEEKNESTEKSGKKRLKKGSPKRNGKAESEKFIEDNDNVV